MLSGTRGIRRCAVVALLAWPALGANVPEQRVATTKSSIDAVLKSAVEQHKVPGVVAMVANGHEVVYQGAFGTRKDHPPTPMTVDTIFRIASMTKPVTSVAIMQLIERGALKLSDPAGKYLPAVAQVQVIDHIDPRTGKAVLRPPKSPVTIAELLTHTSGYVYFQWDPVIFNDRQHQLAAGVSEENYKESLVFDPGTKWEYGDGPAWLGKIVETVSGETLEQYCRKNILDPLGMADTSYNVAPEKQGRLVTLHQRLPEGTLKELPQGSLTPVKVDRGDGGLYSTAGDYAKFMQMILNGGKLGTVRILKPETVAMMGKNHIGDLTLGEFKTMIPQVSADGRVPGGLDKFGYGFAITSKAVKGGRGAGSMEWAGIDNTYFWIDPANNVAAVIMMQILPFIDPGAISVLKDFEHAVYASPTGP